MVGYFFYPFCAFASLGEGPLGRACKSEIIPPEIDTKKRDLENCPLEFPEILHAGLNPDPKNFFLLAFFRNSTVRFPPAPSRGKFSFFRQKSHFLSQNLKTGWI